tara:strand:+ start:274 stop:540 length:267 start_codon:yes stop_codon:yes gene_type:complete
MASIDDVIRLLEAARDHGSSAGKSQISSKPKSSAGKTKPKRKASAYSKKYAKAFKSIAPKHKKKSGGWKQGGYKRAVKQAHAKAKRMK